MGIISWLRLKFSTPSSKDGPPGNASYFSFQDKDLATNETIFAAISLLANSIASAPISLRLNYDKVKPKQSNIARLLEYGPNDFQTTFDFIRLLETLRDRKGVGYAIKEYDRRMNVVSLWVMDSDYVTPVLDTESKELWYRVNSKDGDIFIHNSNIIAVRHITSDGYTPISPVDVLRNTINYDTSIKEFSINQMNQGLKFNLAIKLATPLDADKLTAYDEVIKRFKSNGILYLDKGKEAQALNTGSVIDPNVVGIENITIERVARVFNLPPSKLIAGKSTYSSAEQEDLNFLKDTILPIARMYEQEFTRKLLSYSEREEGYYIKLSLNGFARASMNDRGNFYFKGIRSGWFTINDIRTLEDMAPLAVPEADIPMVSRDLIPVTKIDQLLAQKGGV